MGQDPGNAEAVVSDQATNGEVEDQKSAAELRRDIERTREGLGETAAALAAKADVKGRAKNRVDEVKHTVAGKTDELKQTVSDKTDELKHTVSEKTDEFAHKASDATPASATDAATRARVVAEQNPLASAATGALLIGFALGRLSAKR